MDKIFCYQAKVIYCLEIECPVCGGKITLHETKSRPKGFRFYWVRICHHCWENLLVEPTGECCVKVTHIPKEKLDEVIDRMCKLNAEIARGNVKRDRKPW